MTTNTYHPQTAKFISVVATCIPALTSEVMQGWIDNPRALKQALQLALCPPEKTETTYPTYPVTVDYDLSFEEMIAAGKYDWVNENITTERFPITGTGKRGVMIHLVYPNRAVESQPLIDEMDAKGYRPATIPELLALGAKYPDLQREYPIIALGSVAGVFGGRSVASLDRWLGRRKLRLLWFGHEWNEVCRFAFVRKD